MLPSLPALLIATALGAQSPAPPPLHASPSPPAARDTPAREDLVFAAVGNTGIDAASARRVAEQIARLAPTGPLDFVLLLGNVFAEGGVTSTADPQWQERFEQLFDASRLTMPFYVTPGVAEHQGKLQPLIDHGILNRRWRMPLHTYKLELDVRSHPLTLLAVDTPSVIGPINEARNRYANRFTAQTLQAAAGWKVAFGHLPIVPCGGRPAGEETERMQAQLGHWLGEHGPDVYLCAGDGALEISLRQGVVHVAAGAGGKAAAGPAEGSLFFHEGPGFAWLRFHQDGLEISLRDTDGRLLYVHQLQRG